MHNILTVPEVIQSICRNSKFCGKCKLH